MGMKVNGTSGLTFPDTTTLASAGQASVRAWVNFNGTGTVAIRASYNVTSITDNGTGDYTVNFTTALPDANYAPTFAVVQNATNGNLRTASVYGSDTAPLNKTASSMRMTTGSTAANSLIDLAEINVAIFR